MDMVRKRRKGGKDYQFVQVGGQQPLCHRASSFSELFPGPGSQWRLPLVVKVLVKPSKRYLIISLGDNKAPVVTEDCTNCFSWKNDNEKEKLQLNV